MARFDAAAIEIRRATADDAAALSGLYAQCGYPTDPAHIAFQLAKPDTMSFTFLAELDGKAVGAIELHYLEATYRADPTTHISALVVDEASRSQGIGEKLLDVASEFANSRNCGRIEVLSNRTRERAHAFYERNGFSGQSHRYFRKGLLKP